MKKHVAYDGDEKASLEAENNLNIPDGYECPITSQLMKDPVITASGRSYERVAIETWFKRSKHTDPMTGKKLPHRNIIPNVDLKKAIERFLQERPILKQKALEKADLLLAIQLRESALLAALQKTGAQLGESQAQVKDLNQALKEDPEQAISTRLKLIAEQKNHPRTEIATILGQLSEIELDLDQLREKNAANKIKRYYLKYGKKGLKTLVNESRLQPRKEDLSHQLAQSISGQAQQTTLFAEQLKQQARQHAQEFLALKTEHENTIKAATARHAWSELGPLAQMAEQAEQALKENQAQEKQAYLDTHQQSDKACAAEQSRLKDALQQIVSAQENKYCTLMQYEKPLTALTKTLHKDEERRDVLAVEQGKLVNVLKAQIEAQHKLGVYTDRLFKPAPQEEKKEAPSAVRLTKKANKLLPQFLRHIAHGDQDEAEAMLKQHPELAFARSEFDDISDLRCLKPNDHFKRTFKDISGFQYAAWALDNHMVQMMVRCFKHDHAFIAMALKQHREVRDGQGEFAANQHGRAFDLDPLVNALQTYVDQYDDWNNEQCEHHWCFVVGGEQRKLPAHVINEYCREDRSFDPTPDFLEATLPRRCPKRNRGLDWFLTEIFNNGRIGSSWAAFRQNEANSYNFTFSILTLHLKLFIDIKSINQLKTTRTQQIDQLPELLKAELQQTNTPSR